MRIATHIAPAARSHTVSLAPPQYKSDSKGMSYKRTESLGVINIATANQESGFHLRVQPGLKNYPELAIAAKQYDFYTIERWVLRWVPSVANDYEGKLAIGYDPDTSDSTVPTISSIAVMQRKKLGAIRLVHQLDIGKHTRRKRIRCGPVPGELQSYDNGTIWVRYSSPTAPKDVGEFFLDYHVRFSNPTPAITKPTPNQYFGAEFQAGQNILPASDVAPVTVFYEPEYNTMDASSVITTPPTSVLSTDLDCGFYEVDGVMNLNYDNSAGATNDNMFIEIFIAGSRVAKSFFTCVFNRSEKMNVAFKGRFSVDTNGQKFEIQVGTEDTAITLSTNTMVTSGSGYFTIRPV